ncbi:hypothetical protein ACFPES_03810 [Paenibacillus sp. GCM10023248]|uniref:hypothetical protein n=1 Tax=unclassified Paenibacillus TaxID=185978 RepID=UPI002377E8A6|nr:hypothetical protein [Paenibacillus sp. MAHUQ-63]MDD9266153.1 hypothetical protein [Paenibacillus sp. MAHUQ-63]
MSLSNFDKFLETGEYSRLKRISEEIKLIKDFIREDLCFKGVTREVWKEYGIVGKFRSINRYEYNHSILNEYLFDLGILPLLSNVKGVCLTDEEKQCLLRANKADREDRVYFIPTKLINLGFNRAQEYNLSLNELSVNEKVLLWKEKMVLKEILEKEWESLLNSLRGLLKQEDNFKIKSMFGTVTLKSKNLYCPKDVLELLGKDVLIQSTKVRFEKLEEYAAQGFLNMTEIKRFRRVVNVEQQFVLMDLDKEERCKYWFNQRLNKLSELSRRRN